MHKALTFFSALALATLSFAPASSQTQPAPETVVATVNGEDILLGHMLILYANLPDQYKQIPAERLFDGILTQLIQQTALSQAFAGDEPLGLRLSLENERRALRAATELDGALDGVVSDTALQAAYDAEFADGNGGQEFNASHILVETEAEAADVRETLLAGADFAETAKERSTGPSGPSGGQLGWFGEGQMVPPFESAVVAMTKGDVSEPVQTQFGWHIIQLNDTRTIDAPALAEVRDRLAQDLQNAAVEAHVQGVMSSATIDRPDLSAVSPDVLRDPTILDQ